MKHLFFNSESQKRGVVFHVAYLINFFWTQQHLKSYFSTTYATEASFMAFMALKKAFMAYVCHGLGRP